ncbi:hypothetical protein [Pseudomonas aeruginosa]|uniref:hypothetical protein n=1 Tax=Pseudomonas aeruginosa TaxID=287 RepID=UPI001298704F|nr:hypothetical protein [Pseudomonas aeruginosa]
MNAHANKGFASRIGFGLGTFVRFLITDPKPLRRWVKRTLVSGTLLVLASQACSWLLSGALTLIVLGGAVLAFGGLPNGPRKENTSGYGYEYGPQGYGHYVAGQRTDD